MFWWPDERWDVAIWERDRSPYLALLDDASHLVRAAAADALGALFFGTRVKGPVDRGPELPATLAFIQSEEIKRPGVAGPFLDGANWSTADEWDGFGAGFDMKSWFLETLDRSAREPVIPKIQTLEFYAHELFCADAAAIRRFLSMGRRELAVMTATEAPETIDDLMPVLQEMASSDDLQISSAIREYLETRCTHAGLHHLTDAYS